MSSEQRARVKEFLLETEMALTPTERSLLFWLADFHNEDAGYAWPTVATLSRLVGVRERMVQGAIGHLRKMRLVEVLPRFSESGKVLSNRYAVRVHSIASVQPIAPLGCNEDAQGCNEEHPGGAMECTVEVQPTAPEPLKERLSEPLLEPKEQRAATADAASPQAAQPDFHQLSLDDRLEIEGRWQRERAAFIRRSQRENVGLRDHERLADRKLGATPEDYYALHAMDVAS